MTSNKTVINTNYDHTFSDVLIALSKRRDALRGESLKVLKERSRENTLTLWNDHLGEYRLRDITYDHIEPILDHWEFNPPCNEEFRTRKKLAKLSPKTLNNYLVCLSSFFVEARNNRFLPRDERKWSNPCRTVKKREVSNGRVRYLSEAEYQDLLIQCRVSKWDKLYLLVMLAVTTGLRRGNLLGIKWSDIDFERGEISIAQTKNDTPFIAVINAKVMEELQKFRKGNPSGLVFPSYQIPTKGFEFRDHYNRALRDAGITGCTFHTLRHTHASWLAQKGFSLLEIADSMNHKTLSMTQRYAHLCTESRKRMVLEAFK